MASIYSCSVPGCDASYLRKEHLNRHTAQSHGDNRFSCPHCTSTLARSDLLRRHIKKYHQQCELPQTRAQKACSACRARKERCLGGFPCNSCERRGVVCSLASEPAISQINMQRPDVPFPESLDVNNPLADIAMEIEDLDMAGTTAAQFTTQDYVDLYFRDFHPQWPFLHPSTFDASRELPILVQSVVMIGMWITGHPAKRDAAVKLHDKLSEAVQNQAESWSMPSSNAQQNNRALWPMATYQSILIQLIMALFLAKESNTSNWSLRHQLNADDYYVLVTLVRTCRENGIFYYPNMVEQHSPTAPLAMVWVNTEDIKRFGLALYKVCRMSSLAGAMESSDTRRIDLLELADLDFCMPDSDRIWNAPATMDEQERLRLIAQANRRGNTDQGAWISNAAGALCDTQVSFEWI